MKIDAKRSYNSVRYEKYLKPCELFMVIYIDGN